MRKFSQQRAAIIEELSSVTSHPTASEIYNMVRRRIPNISLGTVYRNLSMLADDGAILRITTGEGTERFDADTSDHYHFCCSSCGRVSDLALPFCGELNRSVEELTGAHVQRHSLIFYGECADCVALGRSGTA